MKQKADARRSDKVFNVGDWVYIKLKSHRQTSVVVRPSNKLAKRYFGPFPILERIGEVAYRLQLPDSAKVHNIFHVSLLKRHPGDPPADPGDLLVAFLGSQPIIQPQHILRFRTARTSSNNFTPQVMAKYDYLPLSEATWEVVDSIILNYPEFHLEDNVTLDERGNVTGIKPDYMNHDITEDTRNATTKRIMRSSRVAKITNNSTNSAAG